MIGRVPVGRWYLGVFGAVLTLASCEDVPIYAPSGATMVLTVQPQVIPADGVSTAVVEARIVPQEGLIADGTQVQFTTSLGTITPVDETEDGVAYATLTAGTFDGSAVITGFSGVVTDTASVICGVGADILVLSVNPSEIPLDTTGVATAVLSPVGKVADGSSVWFTTSLGSITPIATIESGFAQAIITPGADQGRALVTAITGNLTDTVSVELGRVIGQFVLNAKPSEFYVLPEQTVSLTDTLEAFISDRNGEPIGSRSVTFLTEKGSLIPMVTTTDGEGVARSVLTFESYVSEVGTDVITVRALASGQEAYATITVRADGGGSSAAGGVLSQPSR